MESRIFRDFAEPEQQAQLLANLRTFSESDFSPTSASREIRLKTTTDMFDTAALLEFRKGYEYKDIQGRMRQYAKVMHILNGGESSVELFLHDNNLVAQKVNLGNASDCVDYSLGSGQLSLERVQGYFERLGTAFRQEIAIIQAVFPEPKEVTIQMIEVVGKDILSPFLAELFEDARNRGTSMYLRTISGTLAQQSSSSKKLQIRGTPMMRHSSEATMSFETSLSLIWIYILPRNCHFSGQRQTWK